MNFADILATPLLPPVTVWEQLSARFGPGLKVWEPETFQIELERAGVAWTPALAAKILGAQTILVSREWTYNLDVLFAFAYACDDLPAASDHLHYPEPHAIAQAVEQIAALHGKPLNDDQGFDPDRIDPGIAALFHHEGWILLPEILHFAQDELSKLSPDAGQLREEVVRAAARLRSVDDDEVRRTLKDAPSSAREVQLWHLMDCELELRARRRMQQKFHVRSHQDL